MAAIKRGKPAKSQQKTRLGPAIQGHTEVRVAHIANLMRTLQFRTGVTSKALAKEWGICEQRVWEISAMASKRVRAEITDPDRVQATVCTALESALTLANDTGDVAGVCNAAKTWAVVSGAAAPTKTQEVGFESKSDSELAAYFVSILNEKTIPILQAAIDNAKRGLR